jgi:ubiquitin-protein ligase E3 C
MSNFVRDFFTIPLLPDRLPPKALSAFAKDLPFEDLLTYIDSSGFTSSVEIDRAIPLLANIIVFGQDQVAQFKSSQIFIAYLTVLRSLLDRLPPTILASETRAIDAISDTESDGGASPLAVDPRIIAVLSSLPSSTHMSSILEASNRFSATSRPAFAALFVSIIQTWPNNRHEYVAAVVYGRGAKGTGLLREIWRGWLRSGKLGQAIGGQREGNSRVLSALRGMLSDLFFFPSFRSISNRDLCLDPSFVEEWPMFIVLAELYCRTLYTLGDDEFYTPGSRNPLTVDEVVGFSALSRNIAFALYWQESYVDVKTTFVYGTRASYEYLRTLTTTVLQLLHARECVSFASFILCASFCLILLK